MGIDTLVFIGFGVVLGLLFLIIYFKDIESNKKFERFERTIEDLNRQNHQLKQALIHKKDEDISWIEGIKAGLRGSVQEEINNHVVPLLDSLKDIEGIIEEFKTEQQNRIIKLEERTKSINMLSPISSSSNEKQVLQAYKSGQSVHTIAKDLRLGVGEVEFILKMNNLA